MVAPGIVAGTCSDPLFYGYFLRNGTVGYGDVNVAGFEVVDRLGGVALVPGNSKRCGAVLDAPGDEGVCEFFFYRKYSIW